MTGTCKTAEAILADESLSPAERAFALDALRAKPERQRQPMSKQELTVADAQRIIAVEFSARGWDYRIDVGRALADALVRGTRSVDRLSTLAPCYKLAQRHPPSKAQVRDALGTILTAAEARP